MSLNNLVIKFENLLDSSNKETLNNYVERLNFNANPSFVFNRKKGEDEIVPEVRKSKTCFLNDPNFLVFMKETILEKMNKLWKGNYTFKLARDYVTFIKYDKGDFFDWHQDFEKVRINHGENGFKEMHFIYCIQGCLEGGQLLIREDAADKEKVSSYEDVRVSNAAVVFDKVMEHKGAEVLEGTKIIMTVDLYVVSEARRLSGIDSKRELELSELLEGRRPFVSFGGDYEKFKKVWPTIEKRVPIDQKTLIPFVEIMASLNEQTYHVLATHCGVIYLMITRENPDYKKFSDCIEKYEVNGDTDLILYFADKKKDDEDGVIPVGYHGKDLKDKDEEEDEDEDGNMRSDVETKRVCSLIFESFGKDPSDLLQCLIQDLSLSDEDGGIQEWPEMPALEIDVKSLPPMHPDLANFVYHSEYRDEGWTKGNPGYSYYCNQNDYARFDLNYRYGIMKNRAY